MAYSIARNRTDRLNFAVKPPSPTRRLVNVIKRYGNDRQHFYTNNTRRRNIYLDLLKCSGVRWLRLKLFNCHPGLTYIFNF